MGSLLKFNISVVLKHILDKEPVVELSDYESSDSDNEVKTISSNKSFAALSKGSEKKGRTSSVVKEKIKKGDHKSHNLLDFEGPKLITGCKSWLMFYQIMGQTNWIGAPLYFSIIYKLVVFSIVTYTLVFRHATKFYSLQVINENYRNPIFLLMSFLALLVTSFQFLINCWINLFDLCPMYKILTTPKLCFLNTKVQHIIGTKSFGFMLIFQIYNALIINMLLSTSLEDYVTHFNILEVILDLYCHIAITFNIVGMSYLDLYIRSAFGHWLLALKSHLEQRFTNLHKHQRKMRRKRSIRTLNGDINGETLEQSQLKSSANDGSLILFDEIQRNLNNMDDHLEVLRSVQVPSLVMLSLIAFLVNGTQFILTYHLLADQRNFYHGFLVLIVSLNYIVILFYCYSGDRWLNYALSSFVQTVEDEYFMQSDIKTQLNYSQALTPLQQDDSQLSSLSGEIIQEPQTQQLLLIRKKDVLFCHEFLHQFENHLATPWSEFTFKTHLHTLRTFVTLIAAQIIFDHEH